MPSPQACSQSFINKDINFTNAHYYPTPPCPRQVQVALQTILRFLVNRAHLFFVNKASLNPLPRYLHQVPQDDDLDQTVDW